MRRRTFLQLSTAAGLGTLAACVRERNTLPEALAAQIYELRCYHFPTTAKRDAFDQFLKDAMVPALNRLGLKPVGVFTQVAEKPPETTDLWVLITHDSFPSMRDLEPHLAADAAFQQAGKDILLAPKDDPAFTRFDTELLYAFAGHPRLTPAPLQPQRIFEMRTYQSRNQERALNKMTMFNSGEIPIFGRCGMPSVFFGEAIAGSNLPHLTYMVCHESQQSVKSDWANFGKNPDWQALKNNPLYQDNVSNIVSRMLLPTAASQL